MYLIARVSVQTNKGKYSVLEIPNYHSIERIFEHGGFHKDFDKSSLIRYLDTLHEYAQFGKITTDEGSNPDLNIQKHPIWRKLGISDSIKKLAIEDSVIMQDIYEYGEEEQSITIDLINATFD